MNKKHSAKLSYLDRLLSVYIRFIPYDGYTISVDYENGRCYVRVGFYKNIRVMNSNNEEMDGQNTREIKFTISEVGKLIVFYKNSLRTAFAKRHVIKNKYENII